MRHRLAGRHLARTSAHHKAMRRNMAQSLFQHGEIKTTLIKAKEIRPFVERLITLAREGTLRSRQRVVALLGDRAALSKEEQGQYDPMSNAQRHRVLVSRSGRHHRTGKVPASYNKKKYPFVARSVVNRLFEDIAPKFKDRPGGYTRIIRLAERRIGDASDLAMLQLVGNEPASTESPKKTSIRRRQKTGDRIRYLEGKDSKKKTRPSGKKSAAETKAATPSEPAGDSGTTSTPE